MSPEGPALQEMVTVRLAPKNHDLNEAGLSFSSQHEVKEVVKTDPVSEGLRKGRLQFITSRHVKTETTTPS